MFHLQIKSILTIRKGIKELCRTGIIAYAGLRGVYYINPSHFFRGSRVSMYPSHVNKYMTERQKEWEAQQAAKTYDDKLPFDQK
jgi:hypothetical protein